MSWLKHLFPSLKEVTPKLVTDLPDWTVDDAANLDRFLETSTGHRLMERMRHDISCIVLDPSEMNVKMRDEWRAIAHVLAGIESMARVDYWKYRDKEFLEQEYGATFHKDGTGFDD